MLVQKKHKLINTEGERERAKNHAKTGGDKYSESMVWRPGMLVVRILVLVFCPQHAGSGQGNFGRVMDRKSKRKRKRLVDHRSRR